MALIQIENKQIASKALPLLRLGFRPFFLLAGIGAVVLILYWLYVLNGGPATSAYVAVNWHAHEMLFGYSVAVIAGFLLTAEKNWTKVQTLHGWRLAALALLWLAGRIAPWLTLPGWLLAVIDLSFLPILAIVLLPPLIKTSQYQHLIFVVIVLVMFIANLLFHLAYLHPGWQTATVGIRLAWLTIIFLITVMGGRVIPFFIERGTGSLKKVRQSRLIDMAGFITLLGWMIAILLIPDQIVVAWLAGIAAVFQLLRWWGWHLAALWRVPMLWILYLGYGWIPVGLILYAVAVINGDGVSPAIHAFTAGTIGMLTLGMMARVSLGHTGRAIAASPMITTAFVLVTLGPLVRVLGPLLLPHTLPVSYITVITSAGLLWAAGFVLFVIGYLPILIQARIDGRPG